MLGACRQINPHSDSPQTPLNLSNPLVTLAAMVDVSRLGEHLLLANCF